MSSLFIQGGFFIGWSGYIQIYEGSKANFYDPIQEGEIKEVWDREEQSCYYEDVIYQFHYLQGRFYFIEVGNGCIQS